MDSTIASKLAQSKISQVTTQPQCVHALGAVHKSNGKLSPITDCHRPEGKSINNYMETTCQEFTFMKLDAVVDYMNENCWLAVLDLKSAYRNIHISPDQRKFQGFMWDINGHQSFFQDNCLCFVLKCAPYIFSRFTEFIIRSMTRRGHDVFFGTWITF